MPTWLRDEAGSALLLILMCFVVAATILGGAVVIVPALWQNTAFYGQRMLALETAESGLQHAIAWIRDHGIQDFMAQYPHRSAADAHLVPNGGSFWVVHDPATNVLTATGSYQSARRTLSVKATVREDNSLLFSQAIYSAVGSSGGRPVVSLEGSARIIGDVRINASDPGAVYLAWSTSIDGDVYIGPGGDPDAVITGARPNPQDNISGIVEAATRTATFFMPEYPAFPTGLPNRGAFTAGWWPPPPYTISQSGSYTEINAQSQLIFDLTRGDLVIRTKKFSVTGSGEVTLLGDGKLWLYVEDQFTLSGSGRINRDGPPSKLNVFYSGAGTFTVGGSTRFVGSVYTKRADIHLEGSGMTMGTIICGGTSVRLDGAASSEVRTIYAPQASLVMTGSTYLRGAVIVRDLRLVGASTIEWAEVDESELPVDIPPPAGLPGSGVVTGFSEWRVVR